jgi:hypothetical protein
VRPHLTCSETCSSRTSKERSITLGGVPEGFGFDCRGRKLGEFAQPPESRRKLVDHVANELLDAVGVGLSLDHLQPLLVLVGVAEHALASAEQDRQHQQVVTVVQAGVGEVTGEVALPWMMIGPPSVSLSAATSSTSGEWWSRPDMEGGLSRGQGEAAPATVAVDAASG